jgi:uncharacterized membrane protein
VSSTPVRVLLVVSMLLTLAGIGIAAYLTTVHYAGEPIVCTGSSQCEFVNHTKYAKLAGVPVAVFGLVSYVTMLLLIAGGLLRRDAMWIAGAWGVVLASFGFAMYLTYIELFVIDAICEWCVGSASVLTLMLTALSVCTWMLRDEIMGVPADPAAPDG